MSCDAETDEMILPNHPMFDDYNVESALEVAYHLYEPGMSKSELKEELYFSVLA